MSKDKECSDGAGERTSHPIHLDAALFGRIKDLARAEDRTIKGQLERIIRAGFAAMAREEASRGS
jgi:hypothetical protein